MAGSTKPNTVYFSAKGQVVIPHWLRKEFEIKKGTRAFVQATPDGILIHPVSVPYIRSLRGKGQASRFNSERLESESQLPNPVGAAD